MIKLKPLADILIQPKPKAVSRTKIAGWLMLVVAVAAAGKDAVDGGGFDFNRHMDSVWMALNGVGLIGLRNAITKEVRKLQN